MTIVKTLKTVLMGVLWSFLCFCTTSSLPSWATGTFEVRNAKLGGTPSPSFWQAMEDQVLAPKHLISYSNASYCFSDIFQESGGRPMIFGIVRVEGKDYLRLFYLSHSQAVWRVLPSMNRYSDHIPQYDKGDNEHSLDLPPQIQAFLASLTSLPSNSPREISKKEVDILKAGAIRVSTSLESSTAFSHSPDSIGNHVSLEFIQKGKTGKRRVPSLLRHFPPTEVFLESEDDRPDFSKQIRTYSIRSSLMETVEGMVYLSKNDRLEFLVLKDPSNRIFFASIALKDSPISIYGVPKISVIANDLTLPLWEYKSLAPRNFRGSSHSLNPVYFDIWGYIRNVSDIASWYSFMQIQIPE